MERLSIKSKVKLILRKHQETKFNRGRFMWAWLEEFYGANVGVTRLEFLEFWEHEASIERALRDVLKENEFKLSPEQDARRYEKSANMKEKYNPNKAKEDYDKFLT